MTFNFDKLDTGDLLLFHNTNCISRCIQCCTQSRYCHIGMILKDPVYINPKLTGYYLWESSREPFKDAEDNEFFYGVQIVPLEDIIKEYPVHGVYYRKLFLEGELDKIKLARVHDEIHHHRYDLNIIDWLRAGIYQLEGNIDSNDKLLKNKNIKTPKEVWCSALIGYIFVKMGWMSSEIRWHFLSPEDWSYPNEKRLKLLGCFLTPDNMLNK